MSTVTDDRLNRSAVVVACTQAANIWATEADTGSRRWLRVAELHGLVALAHLAHTGSQLPLVSFVEQLRGPLSSLLPAALRQPCDDIRLIEDGIFTEAAADLLLENLPPSMTVDAVATMSWQSVSAEKVQGWLYGQLIATGTQEGYEAARRAVITHAAGETLAVISAVKAVGLPRIGLYEEIPAAAWVVHDAERYWFGCPICRWPMRYQRGRLSCAYKPHETAIGGPITVRLVKGSHPSAGAWRQQRAVELGGDSEIVASKVEGHISLARPVWRYSTIPGCEELRLAKEFNAIPGVTATLWPKTDRYDIQVVIEASSKDIRLDVKDYADPARLVRELLTKKTLQDKGMIIVVPDYRKDQIKLINERLADALDQPKRMFAMTSAQILYKVTRLAGAVTA